MMPNLICDRVTIPPQALMSLFARLKAHWLICACLGFANGVTAAGPALPTEALFTNSLGMRLARIAPGQFSMGESSAPLPKELVGGNAHQRNGDPDERPQHPVVVSKPFYLGAFEVTNEQYEKFDPRHRLLRGKYGFSIEGDEAVVFVSWHEARAFCDWLSKKEGLAYRLPTEAEWEYACRAGTTTIFQTGESLPKEFQKNVALSWYPDPERGKGRAEVVPLHVGKTTSNAWGLFDMHGNVEEWCHDWYGPYESVSQTDPVGRADGDCKVTRGGSHSTPLYYLRSANRMGAIPEEKSWLIGFRIVLGELPDSKPLPKTPPPLHQQNVTAKVAAFAKPDPQKPFFKGPRQYVKIPAGSDGPIFSKHNHVPSIVACANGDLLTIWYTCVSETGRELAIVASRLRQGAEEWEPASLFWDQPDRNDHTSALWRDEKGTLYHFNGYSVAGTWGPLAVLLRTSADHGATWSKARLILPEHHRRQMPVQSIFRAKGGEIILPCDAVTGGAGGTAVYVSRDNGLTWTDALGTIAGIHACVAQLKDGRLMAFGRGDNIDGRMPMSVSADMGRTWQYSASPFPPVGGGQRPLLLRLKEGQLLLVSFTGGRGQKEFMPIKDASGKSREITGVFAALSYDDGKTWPKMRLVSHDGRDQTVETMDGNPFTIGFSSAEPGGYNAICQSDDGVIQLITSRQHYAFNLKWLETPPPAEPVQ
ncbi:MAG: glycoside hydrolase [Pedosphaera sp.]|nr:glycoside hydrolase [Pedosphaera sp.]